MLEAVNSVLQSAPLIRGNADQVSSADSFAANPDRVQKVSQAPYVSPYFRIDPSDNHVVMEIRNPETGTVIQSFSADTELKDRVKAHTRNSSGSVASDAGADHDAVRPTTSHVTTTARQIAAFATAARSGQKSDSGLSVLA